MVWSLSKFRLEHALRAIGQTLEDIQYRSDVFQITVDSALNELGYNEISQSLNIHFFKTDYF